jgi:hypothetical protein
MSQFDWEPETTDENVASNDDTSSALEDPMPAASDQSDADGDDNLEDLFAAVPEEGREAVRKAANQAKRRMEGKFGPVVQENNALKQREVDYQRRIEELAARAPQQATPAAPAGEQEEKIKSELKRLGVSFHDQNTEAQNRQLMQMTYETQVESYLDKGPGKAYGDDFSDDYREELKDTIRANGYNVQAPNVVRAFGRVKNQIERERTLRKSEAQNRAQVGQDLHSGSGAVKPNDAVIDSQGNFDWNATHTNKIRRANRG